MKTNVDLTANGDFSDKSSTSNGSFISVWGLFLTGGSRIPWKFSDTKEIHSEEDMLHKDLVILGNKHDRARYKAIQSVEVGGHCDRCGVKLTIFNSNNGYMLCKKCQESLEADFGKKVLKNPIKDYSIQISSNYWTQYLNHKVR